MPLVLRLLLVEDSEDDALLLLRQLRHGGLKLTHQRVQTAAAMSQALREQQWDLVMSDYSLPGFSGPEALEILKRTGLDLPFIVVSGAIGEETAVAMMKAGAHDYVMKDSLPRLPAAVTRELAAARERRSRKNAEAGRDHLAAIVGSCSDAVIGLTLDGRILSWNTAAERIFGYSHSEMLGQSISPLIAPNRPRHLQHVHELLKEGHRLDHLETACVRKDGVSIDIALTVSPVQNADGRVVGASALARDISKRKQEERERLQLINDLTKALAEVKTLSGLLPICASCKKIRNDTGYWQAVEVYIKEHSQAEFTHSICPECARRLYPEYANSLAATASPSPDPAAGFRSSDRKQAG
jgi:two-component system, OmpR family, sensor histidine kinase VicK